MSAMDKEKIFEKLRNYHEEKFPSKIENVEISALRDEFQILEEKTVSMILSLVYGRGQFTDSSTSLTAFTVKLGAINKETKNVDKSMNVFATKIQLLGNIVEMAKNSSFNFKPA